MCAPGQVWQRVNRSSGLRCLLDARISYSRSRIIPRRACNLHGCRVVSTEGSGVESGDVREFPGVRLGMRSRKRRTTCE